MVGTKSPALLEGTKSGKTLLLPAPEEVAPLTDPKKRPSKGKYIKWIDPDKELMLKEAVSIIHMDSDSFMRTTLPS